MSTTLPFPRHSLVVSCQARVGNPLHGPKFMAAMATAAVMGGARAIRANGAEDIAAIRAVVNVPILGINKMGDPSGVFITPSIAAAAEVVAAGADIVAIDGTERVRPDGSALQQQIKAIHEELGVPVMADVDTFEAGLAAREAGADVVATTLSGYTGDRPTPDGPDLRLLERLAVALDCPVIGEGRFWTPEDVRAGFSAGAWAIVVGTAITNPLAVTRRFAVGLS